VIRLHTRGTHLLAASSLFMVSFVEGCVRFRASDCRKCWFGAISGAMLGGNGERCQRAEGHLQSIILQVPASNPLALVGTCGGACNPYNASSVAIGYVDHEECNVTPFLDIMLASHRT
jgi:hypothetical protein